jgi:hypothetical protein
MKTRRFATFLACLFGAILQLHSQGYLVPNGVTYAGTFSGGGGYGINVVHDPTNGYSTGFDLVPLGKTLPTIYTNTFGFNPIVDVSVRVFLITANLSITTNTLLSGGLTELSYPSTTYVFKNGTPFYLGLYTGNQNFYPPDGIYTDPLFGWVELVNNQGVIQMLDGALEYGGVGIIAGTQTIIQPAPEPSSLALTAVGAAWLASLRRRKF